jgi:CBS domain-containing protein
MKVSEIMCRDVVACAPDASMAEAARLMWKHDCGVVPVIDCSTREVLGVVTDRDLCMASFTRGLALHEMPVSLAMATGVRCCREDDDLSRAHREMRSAQVRRLPVVDEAGRLVGIVSLNDLVLDAATGRGAAADARRREVLRTLAAVCRHREPVTA